MVNQRATARVGEQLTVTVPYSGYISKVQRVGGEAAMLLGAGRLTKAYRLAAGIASKKRRGNYLHLRKSKRFA